MIEQISSHSGRSSRVSSVQRPGRDNTYGRTPGFGSLKGESAENVARIRGLAASVKPNQRVKSVEKDMMLMDNMVDEESSQFDKTSVQVEITQGRSRVSGKLQHALLKSSTPTVHCQYDGQAARHINQINDEFIIVVNSEHKVDVFRRGDPRKVKTLDIEYMRYSLVIENHLFIGTEEKLLYLVDVSTLEIVDQIQTQSYIFSIAKIDRNTVVCGQYQGYIDILRVSKTKKLVKVIEQKLLTGNVYKIIATERPDEFAFGCGNGMFFATFENDQFAMSQDSIFKGKYVT